MDTVRLAYRDVDRTPVIYCIKEMATRHYDLNVEILRISGGTEYEDAIFDGSTDFICEHLEYLYEEVAQHGRKITMFLAPTRQAEGTMVVSSEVKSVDDLRGKKIAVRTSGRPYSIQMRIREMGLQDQVEFVPVSDQEVGRWRQWAKVQSGEAAATFISRLYLPPALEAGLQIFPAPPFDIIGQYHHACTTEFARTHDELMDRYTRATVHAIAFMKLRREEALEVVSQESARLMKLDDNRPELERWYDCIVEPLELKPYPTPEGIAHSYEIGCAEWPGGKGLNPLTLWDTHWLKQIDDEGFIDGLVAKLNG
jgi:ABC-type nitrate/sulfonate/bicarbonate transport system substrate-binding protein